MRKSSKYILGFSGFLLLVVGILMVFSSSPSMGIKAGDVYFYVKRHLFYLALGLLAFNFGCRLSLSKLKSSAWPLLVISIFLLLIVFIPGIGKSTGGASRWIDLKIFSFQPSELAKLSLLIFLASTLAIKKKKLADLWKGFFPPWIVVGIVCLLLLKQPDMGTAISIFGLSFIMIFLAGAKALHLWGIGMAAVLGVGALSISAPYRLRRLMAFIDPWKDPLDVGFHIIQSLLAVGSGGLWGVGLGCSKQKFFYLPQQYADFIFAVFCEELGLIGAVGLIILYLVFFASGIKIAKDAKTPFSSLLAAGIVAMLAVQTFINLMVVVGLLPTTGIPLPFISYGGTAMIINLFCVGLLINVANQKAADAA